MSKGLCACGMTGRPNVCQNCEVWLIARGIKMHDEPAPNHHQPGEGDVRNQTEPHPTMVPGAMDAPCPVCGSGCKSVRHIECNMGHVHRSDIACGECDFRCEDRHWAAINARIAKP